MQKDHRHTQRAVRPFLAAAILAAGPAMATNGYFTHGIGTHHRALAGAGTASPEHSIDAANNMASGVLVGDRFEIGLAIFSPRREYTAGPSQLNGQFGSFSLEEGTNESGSNWFPIPYIAKTWAVEEDEAMSLLIYGRGGMNTDYSGGSATFDPDGPGPAPVMTFPGTFGAGDTGVNLNQLFIEIGYSFKVTDDIAFGVGPVIAFQSFEIEGIGTFAPYTETFAASGGTVMPTNLSNNGNDYSWGYGFKYGAIWDVNDWLNLALSYQTRTYMKDFDSYSDLFAQGGMFDIPAVTRFGSSFRVSDNVTLHGDIEHAQYGEIESISDSFSKLLDCPTAGLGGTNTAVCLGGREGAGFSWGDVTTYKLGLTYELPDTPYTLRFGYNYGENPIGDDAVLVNILAPATVEQHFTFGIAGKLSGDREWDIAFLYAPENSVKATSLFDPTQQIELTMKQFEVEISYAF